jgi:hypothetical protein
VDFSSLRSPQHSALLNPDSAPAATDPIATSAESLDLCSCRGYGTSEFFRLRLGGVVAEVRHLDRTCQVAGRFTFASTPLSAIA